MTRQSCQDYNFTMAGKKGILKFLKIRSNPLRSRRLFPVWKKNDDKKNKKSNQKKIRHVQKISRKNVNLVIIRYPTPRTIGYLKKNFDFHPVHLEDVQSSIQRPKIDLEDEYLFFVLHFPEYNSQTRKIESREIDFFLTRSEVVAIVNDEFTPFDKTVKEFSSKREKGKGRKIYFEQGSGYLLYLILDHLVDSIFPFLTQLERVVEDLDKEIFTDQPRNVVRDISFLRRNVIFFETMIKPELNSFSRLETEEHYLLDENTKIYLSNISDHLKKIWDRLEDVVDLADNLSTTFESYYSFRTNETIKVLTIFSVILMPLTLLSGIYGMNLSFLPLANHPFALPIIGTFMIGMIGVMLAIFKANDWI